MQIQILGTTALLRAGSGLIGQITDGRCATFRRDNDCVS